MSEDRFPGWHGTTIVAVRKNGEVVIAGDGQVSLGQTVIKGTARKVRRISRPAPASCSARRSSWRRTGAPTSTCAISRRC